MQVYVVTLDQKTKIHIKKSNSTQRQTQFIIKAESSHTSF